MKKNSELYDSMGRYESDKTSANILIEDAKLLPPSPALFALISAYEEAIEELDYLRGCIVSFNSLEG